MIQRDLRCCSCCWYWPRENEICSCRNCPLSRRHETFLLRFYSPHCERRRHQRRFSRRSFRCWKRKHPSSDQLQATCVLYRVINLSKRAEGTFDRMSAVFWALLEATGWLDGLLNGTGAFLMGTGLLIGPTGAQESFGLTGFGVVGVLGLVADVELMVDVDRANAILVALFDSLAVSRMDCRSAGLTISYDGCWLIQVQRSSTLGTSFLSSTFFVRLSYNKMSSRKGGLSFSYRMETEVDVEYWFCDDLLPFPCSAESLEVSRWCDDECTPEYSRPSLLSPNYCIHGQYNEFVVPVKNELDDALDRLGVYVLRVHRGGRRCRFSAVLMVQSDWSVWMQRDDCIFRPFYDHWVMQLRFVFVWSSWTHRIVYPVSFLSVVSYPGTVDRRTDRLSCRAFSPVLS